MSVFPRGYGLIGNQVVKTGLTLPASTTSALYTVTGGSILVQFFALLVTTAIQNQACTLSLGNTPTGGSAANTSIALAASIQAKPVGTLFVPTWASSIGGNPVVASGVQAQSGGSAAFLCPAGTITWTTSATNIGQ